LTNSREPQNINPDFVADLKAGGIATQTASDHVGSDFLPHIILMARGSTWILFFSRGRDIDIQNPIFRTSKFLGSGAFFKIAVGDHLKA
jgi:hypothetical protein